MKEIVSKRYDARRRKFILDLYDDATDEMEHHVFRTLEEFSDALDGNLAEADLTKYHPDEHVKTTLMTAGAFVDEEMRPNRLTVTIDGADRMDAEIFYLTDLHLDIKLRSKLGENYKGRASRYIDTLVRELSQSVWATNTAAHMKAIAVGGDVAADMEVVREFYREVGKRFTKAFAVLGNHEFWDTRAQGNGDPVDGCVRTYTDMLAECGVHLLHNSLLVRPFDRPVTTMSEEQILNASMEEIRDFAADSRLTVFGTTGFAALDDVQNAESGMYRSAITSRKQEARYSARADTVYRKLMEAISDQPVLVLSHMPLHSWTTAGYVPQWTYIHGHNHQNNVTENNGAMDYGDNQIGYGGTLRLKNLLMHPSDDMFRYMPDGIHGITTDDYRKFMTMKGMHILSCKEKEIVMLKRDGLYMFLAEAPNGLRILDGGKRLKANHHIGYYYENIPRYAEAIRRFATEYENAIVKVSEAVKKMGGDGRVHGCIVDINYYNHLFLNPFDGKLTPYYATSMRDKYVYPSVEMLVVEKCPALESEFRKMVRSEDCNLPAVDTGMKEPVYYPETDIYGISIQMYKIQHLTGRNVIRQWNDAFLDLDDPEVPRMVVRALIGNGK